MVPLRLIRRDKDAFDGRFFERHETFWPIARAASVFADREDWPDVAEYTQAFGKAAATVRFATTPPRRRRVEAIAREALYDAMIVQRGIVPTRPRMWHDYLNALVWATFPRAKLALHTRQHRAIEEWIPPSAVRLPNARTRELDMLALIDEGGVVVLVDPGGERLSITFGHALYEGVVLDNRAMIARAIELPLERELPVLPEARAELADELLAQALVDRAHLASPEALPRAGEGKVIRVGG